MYKVSPQEVFMSPNSTLPSTRVEALEARLRSASADMAALQHELSRAAIEAASEPERLEELKTLETLGALAEIKSATDQMRQFLWFYQRAINPEANVAVAPSRCGRSSRLAALLDLPGLFEEEADEPDFLDRMTTAADEALAHYWTGIKVQKPN